MTNSEKSMLWLYQHSWNVTQPIKLIDSFIHLKSSWITHTVCEQWIQIMFFYTTIGLKFKKRSEHVECSIISFGKHIITQYTIVHELGHVISIKKDAFGLFSSVIITVSCWLRLTNCPPLPIVLWIIMVMGCKKKISEKDDRMFVLCCVG